MNAYVIDFLRVGILYTVLLRTVVRQESFRCEVTHRWLYSISDAS